MNLRCPLPRLLLHRFPGSGWAFRPALAKRRVLFHLRGFSPPGRFAPSLILRVCCTPLPTMGFIVFWLSLLQPYSQRSSFPSTMRHPSKLFPLQQPSLSGFLPSYRWSSEDGLVSGFFSAGESVVARSCCHDERPMLPWVSPCRLPVITYFVLARGGSFLREPARKRVVRGFLADRPIISGCL